MRKMGDRINKRIGGKYDFYIVLRSENEDTQTKAVIAFVIRLCMEKYPLLSFHVSWCISETCRSRHSASTSMTTTTQQRNNNNDKTTNDNAQSLPFFPSFVKRHNGSANRNEKFWTIFCRLKRRICLFGLLQLAFTHCFLLQLPPTQTSLRTVAFTVSDATSSSSSSASASASHSYHHDILSILRQNRMICPSQPNYFCTEAVKSRILQAFSFRLPIWYNWNHST